MSNKAWRIVALLFIVVPIIICIIISFIITYFPTSDEELFQPHMRKWADDATKTAIWEVYKFIHINTVAPFGTFRTKIRKWKRVAL